MTFSNWMAQILVWALTLNCGYQSYDCNKILQAVSTRQLEEETKVGILVLQSRLWLSLYNRTELETLSSIVGK